MKSSAIPFVGDCGFFSSVFSFGSFPSFSFLGASHGWFCSEFCVSFPVLDGDGAQENIFENCESSFINLSISSESFKLPKIGFILSENFGFCER